MPANLPSDGTGTYGKAEGGEWRNPARWLTGFPAYCKRYTVKLDATVLSRKRFNTTTKDQNHNPKLLRGRTVSSPLLVLSSMDKSTLRDWICPMCTRENKIQKSRVQRCECTCEISLKKGWLKFNIVKNHNKKCLTQEGI